MKFGLKLSDDLEIVLGEFKEEVLERLQESKVKYTIAFDKVNEEGVKETIIQLPDLRVEVSIENDILSYIKSGCNEYSIIFDGTNVNRKDIAVINNLKATILNHFGIDKKQTFIEKISHQNFLLFQLGRIEMCCDYATLPNWLRGHTRNTILPTICSSATQPTAVLRESIETLR